MRIRPALSLVSVPLLLSSLSAHAQSSSGGGGFPSGLLLLGLIVFVVIAWRGARRRAEEQRQMEQQQRMPAPLDNTFGRYEPPAYPPGAYPPPQEGLGSSVGRGLATGLAIGAGAVAAQEIGRRMFEHGHDGQPAAPGNVSGSSAPTHSTSGSAADSPLAHDAGIDAFGNGRHAAADQPRDAGYGLMDDAGWDDAGDPDAGDGGGSDDWT